MTAKELFEAFCKSIEKATVTYNADRYNRDRKIDNWRNFENEYLENSQMSRALCGFNFYFSPKILNLTDTDFVKKCMLNVLDVSDEIVSENLSLAGLFFLYCFAKLEYFGYELLCRKVKGTKKKEYNWHKSVNEDEVKKNFNKFKSCWKINSKQVNQKILNLFVQIKGKRNSFAHESRYADSDLNSDIKSIILIGYYLYYLVTNDNSEFSIKNWSDSYEFDC